MSRLAKKPLLMPEGVKAAVDGKSMTIEGPKGKCALAIDATVSVEVDNAKHQMLVKQADVSGLDARGKRQANAMWGTTFRLIQSACTGVSSGYEKKLLVVGVGYSARIDGKNLVLRCGYANEIKIPIPEGIKVAPPEAGNLMMTGIGQVPAVTVTISGIDKFLVGQFAATLRKVRPPEPYKGKGIRFIDEEVKRKAGKALAAGAGAK